MHFSPFLDRFVPAVQSLYLRIGGVEVVTLALALLFACFTFVVLLAVQRLLRNYLGALAEHTEGTLDDLVVDLIASIKRYVILILAIYAGSLILPLPPRWMHIVAALAGIAFLLQVKICGNRIIAYAIGRLVEHHYQQDSDLSNASGAISFLSRVLLWPLSPC